jgi:hypothetical protein
MKSKKLIFESILIFFLIFSGCVNLVSASFQLGESSLPIDEEGFIDYDWEDKLAAQKYKLKVEFVKLYQYQEIVRALGANISVSKYNVNTSNYELLIVDSIEFQNQLCLLYNKTDQFFRYGVNMNILLINGYGGYYIVPDDPVDINIVKIFIESYTAWSANVSDNTVTIYIGNDQAILTYNEKGILVKEEIIVNNEIISSLTINIPNNQSDKYILIISTMAILGIAALLLPFIIKALRR